MHVRSNLLNVFRYVVQHCLYCDRETGLDIAATLFEQLGSVPLPFELLRAIHIIVDIYIFVQSTLKGTGVKARVAPRGELLHKCYCFKLHNR